MEVPLVNEYKKDFIISRCLTTLFGGLRFKFPIPIPPYVYFIQITLFLFVPLMCGIFLYLMQTYSTSLYCFLYGSSIFIYALGLKFIALALTHHTDREKNLVQNNNFGDEENFEFDSVFGPKTWKFLFPRPKYIGNIFGHSALAGNVSGFALFYLNSGFDQSVPIFNWVFIVFGVVTLSIGVWPLIGAPPPEPAEFHHLSRGSPQSSNRRLICHCLLGCIAFLVSASMSNLAAFATFLSVAGFILSLDWVRLISSFGTNRVHTTSSGTEKMKGKFSLKTKPTNHVFLEFSFYAVLLLAIVVISLGTHLPPVLRYATNASELSSGVSESDVPVVFWPVVVDIFGWTLVALSVVMTVIHTIQRPFFCTWFKNKAWHWIRKRDASFYILAQFIRCAGGLVSLAFVHSMIEKGGSKGLISGGYSDSLILAVSFGFVFRQIWQFPERNLISLSCFFVVQKLLALILVDLSFLDEVFVTWQIHIFHLILWALRGTWIRLKTIFLFSYSAVSDPKQRKLINYFIVGMNFGFAPLLVLVCLVASVLAMPLFPLFTLPLFLISFPRTCRFWPGAVGASASRCGDTVYYQQLLPSVSDAFHRRVIAFGLGLVQPGDVFLLRWEDRFFWVQILECGFIYFSYSVKGLELQETSCHTAEASRVDSIFSRAFDDCHSTSFNQFSHHCLTPLTKIEAFGYSDIRNVLTGVLDSPDLLGVVEDYFTKTLLFLLLHRSLQTSELNLVSGRKSSSGIRSRSSFGRLPSAQRYSNGLNPSFEVNTDTESPAGIKSVKENRQAWDNDNKFSVYEVRGSIPREDGSVVLRPLSWQSDDDPLETKPLTHLEMLQTQKDTGNLEAISTKEKDELSDLLGKYPNSDSDESLDMNNQFNRVPLSNIKRRESRRSNYPKSNREAFSRRLSYNCSVSSSLSLPSQWLAGLPLDLVESDHFEAVFPLDWFKFLLRLFAGRKLNSESQNGSSGEISTGKKKLIQYVLKDEVLEKTFRAICSVGHAVVLGSLTDVPTTAQVFKAFNGTLPKSKAHDWAQGHEDLLRIFIKSFRIAVKLSLDHVLIGPLNHSWEELSATVDEYNTEWFIGPEIGPSATSEEVSWAEAIRGQMPCLFSIGYAETKGVYTSHLLTIGDAEFRVGRMNSEVVRAIWASLSVELLYLTNDDDERYSIQAHPALLRNLTIQAADPPLGYPIFSSPPIYLGINAQ